MNATQETREKRPELFERVNDRKSLYVSSFLSCPCAKYAHLVSAFLYEPLRVYDYAILQFSTKKKERSFIVIAFIYKGEHHWAFMRYNKETHQLLKSFNEKFNEAWGVLLTPEEHRSPKGWKLILKPAV